ncbi:MAG: hypothetical protein COZ06_03345 [Armatimonadetes bacterium CG_4_10_14_3_um_filter_66_18]|nr:MAG: hypothetical protein AUJ96_08180 [Armatimonadetes bacterium CG2_30_66_41]PIU90094.1 MAG: hypothetical protein COS65_26395 [Armatimonadetes bacterium CG06_land_8_20_14_3_00_66_21]PIY52234.1 MAG: hypothetical protein COZ06_03345 [Armatimonadetes bacterium CG_4_10_14_3_um_filter_66_18]PIZ35454.1 MAG: hypothetical protein COY42_26810 [Armatimonadetes bacterium CG_4_10_14_0_8_um_filter_66_14]PJB61232.1 MAG: hypothetical protein CO096_29855 [Armatimonadetes bacterium CG_4_9_14_3_um_filter_66_
MSFLKWFYPGMRVKRWLLVLALGVILVAFGAGIALDIQAFDLSWRFVQVAYRHTRLLVSTLYGGLAIALVGTVLVCVGMRQTIRSIAQALSPHRADKLVDLVFQRRQLEQGHHLVAIGGGTGMPELLRGLKRYTSNLSAIVTMADDGGSTGRLRESGFPPPGDIRNNLVALAEAESFMTDLFQYRFHKNGNDLDGHSFGNLLLAAMSDLTGDFLAAIKETSKVLAIRGQVLPATLTHVTLCAELETGEIVRGQSNVNRSLPRIVRAFLEPANAAPLPEALAAIRDATLIVIGPGSLYSSVIPNLLVKDNSRALRDATAIRVYVCNVMTQPHETDGYAASDHVKAILDHGGTLDYVFVNTRRPSQAAMRRYLQSGAALVDADLDNLVDLGVRPIAGDFINNDNLVRHDHAKLSEALLQLATVLRTPNGKRPKLPKPVASVG